MKVPFIPILIGKYAQCVGLVAIGFVLSLPSVYPETLWRCSMYRRSRRCTSVIACFLCLILSSSLAQVTNEECFTRLGKSLSISLKARWIRERVAWSPYVQRNEVAGDIGSFKVPVECFGKKVAFDRSWCPPRRQGTMHGCRMALASILSYSVLNGR